MSSYPTDQILRNAGDVELEGLQLKMVSFDDLLAAKRQAGRAKDRIDVEELEMLNQQEEER